MHGQLEPVPEYPFPHPQSLFSAEYSDLAIFPEFSSIIPEVYLAAFIVEV
jgi:hypothetical protein